MALPSQVLRPASRSSGFAATGDAAMPMLFAALLLLLIPLMLVAFKSLQTR
jgi:hypothetical protein